MKVTTNQVFGITQDHLQNDANGFAVNSLVVEDLKNLKQAAKSEGIELTIASSFRNLERQTLIWNKKFNGERPVFDRQGNEVNMSNLNDWQKVQAILLYSALPGASRHHWGTDLDVFDTATIDANYQLQLEPAEYKKNGPFYTLSTWLESNAERFNFYRPYLATDAPVAQELWHISHKPTAKHFLQFLKHNNKQLLPFLAQYKVLGLEVIAEHFDDIIDNFVLNIR